MTLVLISAAALLTFRTFRIALNLWKEGNKLASLFVFAMSAFYLPLALYS